MLNKLLGAAAMAAAAYAFVPAHAAGFGCSGADQAKAQGQVSSMADGPGKFMAQREIAQAQSAYLAGHMSQCAMHLANAMSAGAAPPSYSETYARAPYPGPGPYAEAPYSGPYPQRSPYAGGPARY